MTVVRRAKNSQDLRLVGSADGKWFDVIDLEVVCTVALAA
jgi:hypothetical protein